MPMLRPQVARNLLRGSNHFIPIEQNRLAILKDNAAVDDYRINVHSDRTIDDLASPFDQRTEIGGRS